VTEYFLRLLFLIPLVGGLAFGALWLWRKAQPGMAGMAGRGGQREKLVRIVDAVPLGASGRLAVVEFDGKRLLLAVSRTGVVRVDESRIDAGLIDG
jgi:flagellar protein FliO/FliZ